MTRKKGWDGKWFRERVDDDVEMSEVGYGIRRCRITRCPIRRCRITRYRITRCGNNKRLNTGDAGHGRLKRRNAGCMAGEIYLSM